MNIALIVMNVEKIINNTRRIIPNVVRWEIFIQKKPKNEHIKVIEDKTKTHNSIHFEE
jgi:hypothetical protein